jgi:hypothetical protein
MNLCPRKMSDGVESVKRVIYCQSWHNPSRKFLGIRDGAGSVKCVLCRQSWHNPSRKFLGIKDGTRLVKCVLCHQSWHNPSRKFEGSVMVRNRSSAYSTTNHGTILLGSSYGGKNKASQACRPCPYMVLSFVCMYICVYMHVCLCAYIYVCGVYLCGSVYVYICVYTYVRMYMDFFVFFIVYK